MLLLLRFDAPAPGLCNAPRADSGLPPRSDRVRDTPFVGAVDVEDGDLVVPFVVEVGVARFGSVDGLQAPAVPAGGFFVAVDMMGCN